MFLAWTSSWLLSSVARSAVMAPLATRASRRSATRTFRASPGVFGAAARGPGGGDGAVGAPGLEALGELDLQGLDELLRVDVLALGDLGKGQPVLPELHDLGLGTAT